MFPHQLGMITLNISFVTYLLLYFPQILHNLKRRNTQGLSFLMHCILMLGYTADLMYGIGRHMQWQYIAVSIFGLILLLVQHVQIGYYQGVTRCYCSASFGLLLGLIVLVLSLTVLPQSQHFYIAAGALAWTAGIVYSLPQIIKNRYGEHAMAISQLFILLDIVCSLLDTVSAWSLNWDYPSKIGSPIEAMLGMYLLLQILRVHHNKIGEAVLE